ncbi:PilW family protein [Marinobacterium sp. xm-d-564]|uniref:PilW family protein n=1 Tax=Marinobacterium sp. xm-d-564 TaxID=2497742 RepID=UPI00156A0E59|nr:prepilin-type N-terminal cleavage/methylation domain-containing protein [Marinobacterium sp. xm-d-564]NRP58502.1 hypothetical protein [Marinobacterium sp. xm-d-564]
MNKNLVNQKGYTLIELMIGMVVGLIVLSGALFLYLQVVTVAETTLAATRLNRELGILVDSISGEIRRHGYSSAGSASFYQTSSTAGLSVSGDKQCILYAYDGGDDDSGSDEVEGDRKGFRKVDNAIYVKTNSVGDCNDPPDSVNWESFSNPDAVSIAGMRVNLSVSSATDGVTIYTRTVELTVSAADPSGQVSSSKTVSILIPNNVLEE